MFSLTSLLTICPSFPTFKSLVLPLLSFSTDDLSPYFQGWLPSSSTSQHWKPLGEVGSFPIPFSLFLDHVDWTHPKTPSHTSPPPPPHFSPGLWDMAKDLLSLNCITPSTSPANGYFFIKPKRNSDKLRAIFNAIHINASWPWKPTHFSLPNFESVKPALRSHNLLYFHRTDIKNFYWSFLRPPQLQDHFTFSLRSPSNSLHTYTLTRPPFGWDYIPTIANSVITSILPHSSSSSTLTYVDDLLTISLSPTSCHSDACLAWSALTSAGFVLHEPGTDKCSLAPETSTHFVGKSIISGARPSILNTANTTTSALFFAIIGSSLPLSPRAISCISGTLQWASLHNKFARPFFYGLHRYASLPASSRIILNKGTRAAITHAAYLSSLPWTPNDITLQAPPHNTPLIFVDAAFSCSSAAACFSSPDGPKYMRWPLPKFCTSQQDAELYALTRTVRWAASLPSSHCIAADSSSSISSALSLNSGAHAASRARILRKLAICLSSLNFPIFLAWIPSELNPADAPSRLLSFSHSPSLFTSNLPLTYSHCHFSLPS